MTHKSGFLSGPEPEEIEEKTAAELDDEKRPSTMAVSSSMYDLAETDDRPAIEQKAAKGVVFTEGSEKSEANTAKSTGSGAKDFHIDAAFAAEMHERERKEKAERAKKQQAAEAAEQEERAKRKQEIAAKLEEAQTLDEEELKEEISKEIEAENADKLYPDAKPLTKELEDELWRNRTEKGAQIAGRAKIEDVENIELAHTITVSLIIQIIAAIITICGIVVGFGTPLGPILCVVGSVAIIITAIMLFIQANKTRLLKIPSNQRQQFSIATYIPGLLLRLGLIALFSQIPLTGNLIAPIAGAAIGASLHYSFLNRYKIYVSIKNTLINTFIFVIYLTLNTFSGVGDINEIGLTLIIFALSVIEFLLGDRAAMLLALYTNK